MNDVFYSSIGRYYNYIFPYNPDKKKFTKSLLESPDDSTLLDIGCSTGDLPLELAKDGNSVYAIDSEQEMINKALRKKMPLELDEYPVFRYLDMRRIAHFFDKRKFDAITCYGNTLVHLNNKEEISDFLNSCNEVLRTKGHLMIQILNYEYILKENIRKLPVIDNDKVRFERYYEHTDTGYLDFITQLTIKDDQSVLKNRIPLYPLSKKQLYELLSHSGFSDIKFYGGFNKAPFQENGLPLLVEAIKQ